MKRKKTHALAISLDTALLTGVYGAALERQLEYSKYLGSYTLIVLNTLSNGRLTPYRKENLTIIPTNSWSRWLYPIDALRIVLSLFKRRKFNVVTSQDPYMTGLIGVLTKKLTRTPLNIQLPSDDLITPVWINHSLQNRLMHKVGVFCLHKADSFRYDNKRKMKKIWKKFPKVKKLAFQGPMFVDLSFFERKVKTTGKIRKLIAVGRVEWEKNFPLLIDAVVELIDEGFNLKLTIVGGGSLENRLKRLIGSLDKEKQIRITGFASKSQVRKQLHDSDLFVLSSYYEGWAMVVMEALAAGLPVVMTNVGNAGELVVNKEAGLVVASDDKKTLKKAIAWAIDNPKRMYEMAKKGQKKVKKENSKEKLISVWVECLYETSQIKN
jgi:glycosyltransferase involved in cell wall biosynthesis